MRVFECLVGVVELAESTSGLAAEEVEKGMKKPPLQPHSLRPYAEEAHGVAPATQ
jgi:hypothetical protein